MSEKVAIIVLNWNGYVDTIECLRSLDQLEKDSLNIKIFVVDNDSYDRERIQLLKSTEALEVVNNKGNFGFSGGNNTAIIIALMEGFDYIWLLNNDTRVSKSSLYELVSVTRADRGIGITGSRVVDMREPHNLQMLGGGDINFFSGTAKHITDLNYLYKLDYISGASMFIRSNVLKDVGLLDNDFFMYWEDAEFCIRARQAGWRIAVAERSIVYHKESSSVGKSSSKQVSYYNRSARLFFSKCSSFPYFPIFVGQIGRSLKIVGRGTFSKVEHVWK